METIIGEPWKPATPSDLGRVSSHAPRAAGPAVPPQAASVAERKAAGRRLRERHPLKEHAIWRLSLRRHDPIDLLIENTKGRIESLVPIRYGRMLASPFAFLRGSAAVMAGDLSRTPGTGLHVQACGDAHLVNFRGLSSPERRLIFEINDFDETAPAPWEWDVKRLVASFVVAGRDRRFAETDNRECAWRAARAYRKRMVQYAEMPVLKVWYERDDLDDLLDAVDTEGAAMIRRKIAKATAASSHHLEFEKLAERTGATPRILDQPPLIFHFGSMQQASFRAEVEESFRRYKNTLAPEVRILIDRYELVDVAAKVVGVGSVGTFCCIALLHSGARDPLFLQVKEARQSVLEPYAGASRYAHHGERVARGQRLMQSASDIFLGWATGAGERQTTFYVRQLADVKIKPPIEVAVPRGTKMFARFCGAALARAHARSGDPVLLSAYMDGSFEDAMADFAVAYADQTERDYQALAAAVRAGRMDAETE